MSFADALAGPRVAIPTVRAPDISGDCDISGVRPLSAVIGWPRTTPEIVTPIITSANRRFTTQSGTTLCSATVVVRLTLSITAARGESWRLIDALRSLKAPTQRERGCVRCRLVLSSESCDPARISYVVDWSSEDDLREQVRSDRFPRLLELMERALEPPHLEFQLAGGTRGLDYVEEVRAHHAAHPGRSGRKEP
jgi:quinol monooxygenase YgiN